MAAGPRPGPHRNHGVQQLFYCCMDTFLSDGSGIIVCLRSCCLATRMFTETFPNNGSLYWFHSSGFQQTCHNIKRDRLKGADWIHLAQDRVWWVLHVKTIMNNSTFCDVTAYSPLKIKPLPPAFTLVSCSAYSSTLKMEATCRLTFNGPHGDTAQKI
jgi:hypothetical protein